MKKLYKLLKISNQIMYLYDAFENRFIEIDNKIYNTIEYKKKNDLYYNFIRENNLRDIYKEEQLIISSPLEENTLYWKINNRQKALVISLTEDCNMRCEYCGYKTKYSNSYDRKTISKDILRKAISNFLTHSISSDESSIAFYGGEPLLKFDLIKESVNFVKQNHFGQKIMYLIITNGLLLNDPDIVDFLINNNFYLIISLDGPQEIHDRYRVDISGNTTYQKVKQAIKSIQEKSPTYFENRVSFNAVIAPPFSGKVSVFFKNQNTNFLDLEVTKYFREKYLNNTKDNEIIPTYTKEIVEQHPITDIVYQLRRLKKYHNLLNDQSHIVSRPCGYCSPYEKRIFVTTSGKLVVCEKVDENDPLLNIGTVDNWIDYHKLNCLFEHIKEVSQKNCANCWAVRLCPTCYINYTKVQYDGSYCTQKRKEIEQEFKDYLEIVHENPNFLALYNNFSID